MKTKHIECKFAMIGARLRISEIPSRAILWNRQRMQAEDYAVDIRRDDRGQFFELRVPAHLRESLDVTVTQAEPKQRHLLLFVRKLGEKSHLDRFLCGHDE